MVSFVSGKSYAELKGVVELLAARVNPAAVVTTRPSSVPQFMEGRGAEVLLNGRLWGWLGELDRSVTERLDLRDAASIAELDVSVLEAVADLVPQFKPLPSYQGAARDLNFVLDDIVTWSDLDSTVKNAAGPLLESVGFGGQYRGKQIPEGKRVPGYVDVSIQGTNADERRSGSGPAVSRCCLPERSWGRSCEPDGRECKPGKAGRRKPPDRPVAKNPGAYAPGAPERD